MAIDADSKLIPSWAVGRRDAFTDHAFMLDLASRLANKVQLTTDGHKVYLEAVEEANLTMRIGMRRFTRLTHGFSKNVDNHKAVLALYFVHYNFARSHKTLRVMPAMEAGVAGHVWSLDEVARLVA